MARATAVPRARQRGQEAWLHHLTGDINGTLMSIAIVVGLAWTCLNFSFGRLTRPLFAPERATRT